MTQKIFHSDEAEEQQEMPKKRTDGMQKMTVAQQQEVIERFHNRVDVRKANDELARVVLIWASVRPIDRSEFMKLFEAGGHSGEYQEVPSDTTRARALPQAAELPNILKRLADTPLDYMGAIELSYVYERIQMMREKLESEPKGTMEDAIRLYYQIGAAIREKVFTETGHYPEEFPVPRGRITGKEESTQFKLKDHQPPLL